MNIRIYQINRSRDVNNVAFDGMELLERFQGSTKIDSSIYDKVFDDEVDCLSLEGVFGMFNTAHPADYRGRSLSVSDVVEIVEAENVKPGFYFCDSIGFKEIQFEPEKTQHPKTQNTITVVLLEPGKVARKAEIDASLKGMQRVVGGSIEEFCPFEEEIGFICNEDGKIEGLPLNRAIREESDKEILDIIAGTCFICDCSGESFASLSAEQVNRYMAKYRYPERFIRVNDEIKAIPFKPNTKDFER